MKFCERFMCLAIPGKILDISNKDGLRAGRVEFGGMVNQVCLNFVPDVNVGDYVVVHVGFALSRVDREEAERTYQLLEAMGLLEGELSPSAQEAPETAQ